MKKRITLAAFSLLFIVNSACAPDPPPPSIDPGSLLVDKIVFVTSGTTKGDMQGVTGADEMCMLHAKKGNLPGVFKAWISDNTTSPSEWPREKDYIYRLVNGTIISKGWFELTNGYIEAPINIDQRGNHVGPIERNCVWTATNLSGTGLPGPNDPDIDLQNCYNWTSNYSENPLYGGNYGNYTYNDKNWTWFGLQPCQHECRLYCFQQ